MALRIAGPKASTASVIFLHGLGDSGRGWSFFAGECYKRPGLQHVDFVLPSAPIRQYPAFGGPAPGWFGMNGMGTTMEEVINDFEGIKSTLEYVRTLVQAEIDKGVSPDRIIVGGFSQGAAMAQCFAATYSAHKLAGFISLSGFLPHKKELAAMKTDKNAAQPVFIGHGTSDPVVPYKESEAAERALASEFGFTNIQHHKYPGLPHSVAPEELEDILDFMEAAIPPQN